MLWCWKTLFQFCCSDLRKMLTGVGLGLLALWLTSENTIAQQYMDRPAGSAGFTERQSETHAPSSARIIAGQIETLLTPAQARPKSSSATADQVQRPYLDPLAVATRVDVANRQTQRSTAKRNVVSAAYYQSAEPDLVPQGAGDQQPIGNTQAYNEQINQQYRNDQPQRELVHSRNPAMPGTSNPSRNIPERLIPPGVNSGGTNFFDSWPTLPDRSGYPRMASWNPAQSYDQIRRSVPALPAEYRFVQDGDPFGQQSGNNVPQNNSNPFGDAPQNGRIDPFADPPQNNMPQNGKRESQPQGRRQDPFADPPQNQLPQNRMRQDQQPQDPQLPGNATDVDGLQQKLPIPEPARPRDINRTPRAAGPITRPPTKNYGTSRFTGQAYPYGYGPYGSDSGELYVAPAQPYPPLNYPAPTYPAPETTYPAPTFQPECDCTMYGGVATEEGLDAYDEEYFCDEYACCEPLFYLSVFGGYAGLDLDGQAAQRGVLNPTTGTYDMGSGYGLGVALGQTQGANLRSELEFAFRSNKGDAFRLSDIPNPVDLGGNVDTYSGMLNFIWDFNSMECFPRVRPYVGAGVGFTFINPDLTTDAGMALHSPELDNNSSFAYQVMLGTTFQYSNSINWFVEYRYFGADSIQLESNPDPANVLFGDFELKSSNVFAGIRLSF